jgi:hypothetical protein
MKLISLSFFSILFIFFSGCDMNTSVDFILKESKIYTENDIDFSVDWRNGVPLYYFIYKPQRTAFVINLNTDLDIKNVTLKSYMIEINELGVNMGKSDLSDIIIMRDSLLENNSAATKRFWGGKKVDIDVFLPESIKNERQLEEFKKVNYISLTVVIEYTKEEEQKSSIITWIFAPRARKSFAIFDKWMSV